MADRNDSILILPNGKLSRCEHYIDKNFVGDIINGITRPTWNDYYDPFDTCFDCPCLPDCIFLKECPSCKPMCYDFEKTEKIMQLKNLIKRTYDSFNDEKEMKTDDEMSFC